MPKPTAQQILARIAEMEEIRNEAEAAGDSEHVEKAVRLLGLLWVGFLDRWASLDGSRKSLSLCTRRSIEGSRWALL